jgi:hypothetical protein
MVMLTQLLLTLGALASTAAALVTPLSAAAIAGYAPYTELARAAYCPTDIATWACGGACSAVAGFTVAAIGGDGDDVQYCELRAQARGVRVLTVVPQTTSARGPRRRRSSSRTRARTRPSCERRMHPAGACPG